jgi:pimeloyl-ACP methyl ester carboxylesterase
MEKRATMIARCFAPMTLFFALGMLSAHALGQGNSATPPAKDLLAQAGFGRHFVEVKDAKLSYVLRKAAGPSLILIPGSFESADTWLGVVAKLDPKLQIVVVELRGQGQSWPPPSAESGTIPQFAKDVLACADHAGLKSFYVGGHSIGGMVAIECAGQQPDRLRGVLAIEGWTRALVAGRAFKGKATDCTLSEAQKKRRFELRRPTTSRWTQEQLFAFAQIWEKWNGTEILEKTSVPVLEFWGDRGEAERPSRKVMHIPDRASIDLVWVAGASHFLLLERPEETAAAMNSFVRKVETARQH